DKLESIGKHMFVDLERRNVLFCMYISNTREDRHIFRYTSNQCDKETVSRIIHLRQDLKSDAQLCEEALSFYPASTVNTATFSHYPSARAIVDETFSY
ncbi:hypothetical protein BDF14DRAFT_1718222, partial [Spinellus fusiger]